MNAKRIIPAKKWLFASLAFCVTFLTWGQAPFLRTGQVFLILQNTNELQEFTVQPSYNSINTITIGALPSGGFDALGFRRTDNRLYGIGTSNNHLYRVGQNAAAQDLGAVGLDNALYYLAGDVSPDGKYLYSVGSNGNGTTMHLAKTDLETAGFPTQFVSLGSVGDISDIAFDPTNAMLYGFDQTNGQLVIIDPNSGSINALQPVKGGNRINGLYFDAFGDLYGVGTTLNGIVDGYFVFDKVTGKETRLTTGPASAISDMASCPYSVEMKSEVNPGVNLPCTEISYTYKLANGSEETFSGLEFVHALPSGFHLTGVLSNTFGAFLDTLSIPGSLRMENIVLTPGIRSLTVKMLVDDIPKGRYNSQPIVQNLPTLYGTICRSDNVSQPGFEDSTAFVVNRFDEDSLEFRWLICHGEILELESSAYGNNVHWNSGSTAPSLSVNQGGLYSFVAGSSCEEILIKHNVTSASCPFTIAVAHIFEPDTSFACKDVIFSFIISNDSGEPRPNLSFVDTLPVGFTFVEIVKNPFGGTLMPNLPGIIFSLEGLTLKEGIDTIKVKVHIGDVPPKVYKNRARLIGLPILMGPLRLSDDPRTFKFDSSSLQVIGALSDSLFYDEIICAKTEITLDASPLGKTFLWDDGSTGPKFQVETPGEYHLTIFDGCEPANIFWHISEGLPIAIDPSGPFDIHQGEEIQLQPFVRNQGDSLGFEWYSQPITSLSCLDCPNPSSNPLESTVYVLKASNEQCSDSVSVLVNVDKRRRIYAANIFSPNDDGNNDLFFLQSPDYGKVLIMGIYDRWGNQVFQARDAYLDSESPYWDGRYNTQRMPPGTYVWCAEIEFIDGMRQVFTGDVTIVR